ncbi:MAG: 1-acyl-sn-glycerol-3-phosphate acyltransferase [Bacteroidales bacterium]|jgi:1-acyl-sn-glycerol-3-phosphate acyltransferase|nr:1-acyl-sn-glycerol-3-phosphate acyltransferase [Bacteroidales bacterium]
MDNFILSLYNFFTKHKVMMFCLLILLILLLIFSASRISFKEDISAFLSKEHDTERINYVYQHIGSANKLLVTVSMSDTLACPDEELIIEAVCFFAELMQKEDSANIYYKKIEFRIDQQQILSVSNFLVENMPYFFTEQDYNRMDTLLTIEYVRQQMHNNKQMLMLPIGMVMKQNIMNDPLHLSSSVLMGLRDFQVSDQFQMCNDFIFSKDRKEAIITIESQFPPSETRQNELLLRLIDKVAAQTHSNFDYKIKVHYFGSVDIAVTNSKRIKKDSLISCIIAIILILSILIFAFRSSKNLLLMFISLLFGWLFAIGILSLFKNEISIIAVGISSIIIGVAVNYPLHFIMNRKHESHIPNVIKNIVTPLTIGNITTVGAFLSLLFISSEAMHDLGLFAALLLAGTIFFVLLFLPHLLGKSINTNSTLDEHKLTFGKLLSWKPKRRKWFLWVFLALTILFCLLSFNTKFDTNMQNINYMTETQQKDFKKMISTLEQGQKTIYFVSNGENMDEALEVFENAKITLDSMQNVGIVTKVSGVGAYLPSKTMQKKRVECWKQFCEKKKDILAQIDEIGVEAGFISGAFSRFNNILSKNFELHDIDFFEPLIATLAHNYIVNKKGNYMVMAVLHTNSNELDELEDALNAIHKKSFAFDVGTIGRNMVSTLSNDFDRVLFICSTIVFLFLLFTFGRIELTLLAFLPLTVGWFWILGIMDILDIRFNIVNIILATFIFGQGDDYTIFITEGLIYEYAYKRKLLVSYKNTITLSSLVMFVGIGTLILAKHPALRSLAEVTIIGMGSVVLMAFLLPQVIFKWLTKHNGKQRLMPITLLNLSYSIYAFVVFLLGTFFLTLAGFFVFTFGKTTDKKKMRFHRLIYKVAHYVVMRIPRVKTIYNNFDKTIFDKPAVIICNHQSHIDLMCIMSLSPKLIILTNDWVWNSPFYGKLIKYADFYPVSNGIENAIDKLQAIVEKGYSIMIFPEGTRSEDCSIQRFHRGAFLLAEHLKLDIIPVLIHGVGHLLPKKEFMLRKGEMRINVLPRVAYNALGENYVECSKNMRKFYKEEYAKLVAKVETPNYYSDLVIHNYIYKGISVERIVRRNLKKYHNYCELIYKLSHLKRVLILNCGYGELPLLLSLVNKNIEIMAVESDPDKLELAANCTSVPSYLHYALTIEDKEIESFDAVVNLKIENNLRLFGK